MKILSIDLGGSHVKVLLAGKRSPRKAATGPEFTPKALVETVEELTEDWGFDRVALGYPGVVLHGKIAADPLHLGEGWVGFDFASAFGRPIRILNDAAMQALGDYEGGRMLFLGLGTGLGSAMIVNGVLQPTELAHLPYKKGRTFEDYVGERGLERLGKRRWRREVLEVIERLRTALEVDDVVIGGGNASKLKDLPPGARIRGNARAFIGGFRVWAPEGRAFDPPARPRPARKARPRRVRAKLPSNAAS